MQNWPADRRGNRLHGAPAGLLISQFYAGRHRIGDKALLVRKVMQFAQQLRCRRITLPGYLRTQRDMSDREFSMFVQREIPGGVVDVAVYDQFFLCTDSEESQHVAGRDRGDES